MDKKKAKYIASIIELLILFILASYLITKLIGKYYIEDVKVDYRENRQNPNFAFLGGFFGKSPFEVFNGIMGQKVTIIFKQFLSFLMPVFKIFQKIFKMFQNSINKVRNLLRPIRNFFKQAAEKFYRSISKYIIGAVYSLNKIRNSMRRTMSGFNLIFHTLEHSKNSLQSIIQSPPVKIAVAIMEPLDWISESANKLFCFDAYTPLFKRDRSLVFIKDVQVGDILEDESHVVAVQKFKCNSSNKLYRYKNNIMVTGQHKLFENDKWIFAKDSVDSVPSGITPEFIYCITTSSGVIDIYNTLFKDYSESNNKYLNYTVNSLILSYLNGAKIDSTLYAYGEKYLEHGFGEDTEIIVPDGIKKIKDIKIGDIIGVDDLVIGKVEIDRSLLHFFSFNGIILSSNMKVYEEGVWKNIEKAINKTTIQHRPRCFNIVTISGYLYTSNRSLFLDYLETKDPLLNSKIDNLTENM